MKNSTSSKVRNSVFQGKKIILIVFIFCKKKKKKKERKDSCSKREKKGQERMRRMNELETDAKKKMEAMEICLLLEEKAEVITI